MKISHRIRRFFYKHSRCPLCGGRMRFNWWFLFEADTYFYCSRCCVALARLGGFWYALMLAFAAGQLFNYYQDISAARSAVGGALVGRALLYLALILLVRAALTAILFVLKYAKIIFPAKRKPQSAQQDLWWEDFSK
jgi:hypothetical protein